jgi:dolichyl-phosphate-mannose-protein mannosyltransferase
VFIIYFSHFTEGGKADPIFAAFQRPWVTELEYPKGNELGEVLAFIPEFHEKMLNANRDPEVAKATLQSPDPITWPVARANILFWVGDDGKRVDLMPNELLWFFSFFVLLAEVGWVIWHMATTRTFGISRVEILLLLAYAGNYLPFFFIDRPMFLYHYFTSLLFLFLLIPFVLPRIIKCIATVTKDRNFAYAIMSATILLALVNFFLLAPTTYGF